MISTSPNHFIACESVINVRRRSGFDSSQIMGIALISLCPILFGLEFSRILTTPENANGTSSAHAGKSALASRP